MSTTVQDFLSRCFAPGETIAFLLRTDNPERTFQRIVTLETALGSRYLGWLAYLNQHGTDVYVAANPLCPRSRQLAKENMACVRHLYMDIDTDSDARLAALRASDAVPPVSIILTQSPGKYQVLWRVDGFDFEQQEQTLKLLAITFGGDPARMDCNRMLCLPGFLNHKHNLPYRVTVTYSSECTWTLESFHLDKNIADAGLRVREITAAVQRRTTPIALSNSISKENPHATA